MPTDLNKVLLELAEVKRKLSQMQRWGTVKQVEKGKVLVTIGKSAKGEDYDSPWLDIGHMKGGLRERPNYQVGQNVCVMCVDGDPAKAFILPYAPNQNWGEPEHADAAVKENKYASTKQTQDLRERKDEETLDYWIHQGSSGGGKALPGGSVGGVTGMTQATPAKQQKDESLGEGTKALMKVRMNKKGGFTARVTGTDIRVSAYPGKGAKIRTKNHWVVVTPSDIFLSKPPVIAPDPVPNDDK